MITRPIQKIIFGSPGTGKSHRIDKEIIPNSPLNINNNSNIIKTVFHPEYTYGDFMGKLMPLTDGNGKVEYKYYTGHFIKAISKAYKNLINASILYNKEKRETLDKFKKEKEKSRQDEFTIDEKNELQSRYEDIRKKPENVVLVIDELNRGNSASIFGTVFQLLDRNTLGWSQYHITISDLEAVAILLEVGLTKNYVNKKDHFSYEGKQIEESEYNEYLNFIFEDLVGDEKIRLQENKIKLTPNFSILATMNTSDNSIYFMDSAFKRRWDWEFINIEDDISNIKLENRYIKIVGLDDIKWTFFVNKLNEYIRNQYTTVRKIEDKQISYFFINEDEINEDHIKNKLMFFIWDSVFSTNRKPIIKLLGVEEKDLVTFGQFTQRAMVLNFVRKILGFVNV